MGSDQKETREVLAGKHGHQYETAVDRGPLPKMSLRAVMGCPSLPALVVECCGSANTLDAGSHVNVLSS